MNDMEFLKPPAKYIIVCGTCTWYDMNDDPEELMKRVSRHLNTEHPNDSDAGTDVSMYELSRQIQLGINVQIEICVPKVKKGKR